MPAGGLQQDGGDGFVHLASAVLFPQLFMVQRDHL